jgi:hypothetical protein
VTEPHDEQPASPAAGLPVRAADRDREAVAEQLRDAAGDGRLDFDELDQRLEATYAAKTRAELEPLVADLAVPPAPKPPVAPPPPVLRLQARSGGVTQNGHWVVPERIEAECTSGSIKIDFTAAVCERTDIVLDATARTGSVTAIVPRGWAVRIDESDVGSGTIQNRATDPPEPGAPLLRVHAHVRSGTIKVRYPRRKRNWFWLSWLGWLGRFRRSGRPELTR